MITIVAKIKEAIDVSWGDTATAVPQLVHGGNIQVSHQRKTHFLSWFMQLAAVSIYTKSDDNLKIIYYYILLSKLLFHSALACTELPYI